MKSAKSLFFSLLLVSSAVAHRTRKNMREKVTMGDGRGKSVGAAYFITNEPSGNFVVAADLHGDGTMVLREAVSAGGIGIHGINAAGGPNGPDPLFSQGAVQVSKAAKALVTVNSGSNTVAAFSVNPSNPSDISMIGFPVGSGGEFPVSVAINKAGNVVCVLNGGVVNGVNCFSLDTKVGLISIANRALGLNETTPATGPGGSVSQVLFSEDNTKLLVSVKGVPPTPGFLAVWDIAVDGSLSETFQTVTPPAGGILPFSMTIIPGKDALLVTDPGLGFDIFDLSIVTPVGNSSELADRSSATSIQGQGAICWSSFSPKTKNYYLADAGTSLVTEVSVDAQLHSKVVKQYDQGFGSAPIDNDIASIGHDDFLYILTPNMTAVHVVSLIAPGNTHIIQKVDIAGPAEAAGLPISASQLQGMTTFII